MLGYLLGTGSKNFMRKTSSYLIFIVIIGLAVISGWVYQKYLKKEEQKVLLFRVERGDIMEIVKVRGEVAAAKDFDLEFPFSGTVEDIPAIEGGEVKQGEILMKLDIADLAIDLRREEAILAQKKSNLDKLLAGATTEEIKVAETKAVNAKTAVDDARHNLVDKLKDAYTKADDAIRNRVDQFFSGAQSSDPKLSFTPSDPQLKIDLEWERKILEPLLSNWKKAADKITAKDDLTSLTSDFKGKLNDITAFLDKAALAVNGGSPGGGVSQTTLDTWRSDTATGRTNVNAALNNLSAAEEKLRAADSALALAESELALKKAKTRSEDIAIAEAQVKEAEGQIAETKDQIRKSRLYAPTDGRVAKIYLEKGEIFQPGSPALAFSATGYKLQADVSELEIGKVRAENPVSVSLDAFPGRELRGRLVLIETKEIVKDTDKYYRINVAFDRVPELAVRPGMSADLIIETSEAKSVLKIPAVAVYEEDGEDFVTVKDGDSERKVQVTTGVSDGESIAISEGLSEGQTVIVSAE